ncbi:MAG: hypothetical protein HQK79_08485 [Desulfobacterales bacterium]|nr:hypothetical protein [Desulfobacterales bacterium]
MKKHFLILLCFLVILFISSITLAGDVDTYQSNWIHKALVLQRNLDANASLSQVLFQSTHNSYNSAAYRTLFRYIDPNHKYSLKDQLRMDTREIELDVHRYFSMKGWPWQWKVQLLLSHGTDKHIGVGAFDRTIDEGLTEIRDWANMAENKNEILIIDIEDHMDGEYARAVKSIESILGALVYRPTDARSSKIPMNITKTDILKTGKRILFISKEGNNSSWNNLVFNGVGDRTGFIQYKPGVFRSYPDCGCYSGELIRHEYDNYLIRFYEDSTNLSKLFSDPGPRIIPSMLREMVRCGVNIPSVDQLEPYDGKLQSSVWSWDVNKPDSSGLGKDYVAQNGNGRFDNLAGNTELPCACKNIYTNEWYISDESATWDKGNEVCVKEAGIYFKFGLPINGYDNEKLKEAKSQKGVDKVWINYGYQKTLGKWMSSN